MHPRPIGLKLIPMLRALRAILAPSKPKTHLRFLAVMRHAHALPADLEQSDIERELSDHGQACAKAQGAWLADTLEQPLEAAYVSPASRAQQTFTHVAGAAGGKVALDAQTLDSLYESPMECLAALDELPTASALIVTHNPGLGLWLADTVGGSPAMSRELVDINPGDLALLCYDDDAWHLIQLHRAPADH